MLYVCLAGPVFEDAFRLSWVGTGTRNAPVSVLPPERALGRRRCGGTEDDDDGMDYGRKLNPFTAASDFRLGASRGVA